MFIPVTNPEPTDGTVLATLRGIMPNLSPSEARVAQAAINDPAGTAASTIGELAPRCDTSETTVIRLSRRIGFAGYPEFRLSLAAAAATSADEHEYRSGEILPGDTTDQVVRKVTGADAQAITDTAAHVSIKSLEDAAKAIGAARRIDLFGAGASSFVAQDMQFKLHRIGLNSLCYADPHAAISSAALLGRGDVALGLSHTGSTRDTIRYLEVAAESGATTVAITNHPRARIARTADVIVTTAARETTFRSGAMASRIAQLTLVDVLFVLVAQQRVDAAKDALQRTYDAEHPVVEGQEMTVATREESRTVVLAAAAPLWASAEVAREVAGFGGSSYPAYRDWVRRLLADRTPLVGRLHTVALCGEPVRVLATAGPSLVKVELLAQPNGSTGYVGFMNAAHVGTDARRRTTHVAARGVDGITVEREDAPVELPAGATVELLAVLARLEADYAKVLLPSGATLLCPVAALRPVGSAVPAVTLLRIAAGFLGVPYLWGGTESSGIDCSGLVHLAARIGGHVVPRDAHYQWAATCFDADWDDLDSGDLIFFGESATLDGIEHVGVYAGEGLMLHAPEEGRRVTLAPIDARARARAVGFGRYPSPNLDQNSAAQRVTSTGSS